MPKYRLNQYDRLKLSAFARKTLDCPAERAAEVAAHEAMVRQVDAFLLEMCPAEDLAVIVRHNSARKITELNFVPEGSSKNGLTACFCLRDWTQGPSSCNRSPDCKTPRLIPGGDRRYNPVHEQIIPEPRRAPLFAALRAYDEACKAHDAARGVILEAADSVIYGCRNLEDLIKKWPAAEAMREKIAGKQLPAVIESDATRILGAATFGPASLGSLDADEVPL